MTVLETGSSIVGLQTTEELYAVVQAMTSRAAETAVACVLITVR